MENHVEQIKSRLDIVQFIGAYVKLQKTGSNFKARCPFHNEKTPSFTVSPARETWHCFGCSKGGDIFSFIMEYEHVAFPEALRILAERAGVEITREKPGLKERRLLLLQLLEDAAAFFEDRLKSSPASLGYLQSRGISEETVTQFRIGFAPDSWRDTIEHLKTKGYSVRDMNEVGLVVLREQASTNSIDPGSYYDRFRSRIIFPLVDAAGRVVGFGGRIIGKDDEKNAKYINSPQTPFYDKSKFLYNFFHARQHMRDAGNVVFVEGYMDAVLSHQAGVKNVVASSGTAFTKDHMKLARRLTEKFLFAFDMDTAGYHAAFRAVILAAEEGVPSAVIELAPGCDPADVASKDASAWQDAVKHARESIGFFIDRAIETYGTADGSAKRQIGAEVLPLVSKISSEIEAAHWVRELSGRLGISEHACWAELERFRKDAEQETSQEFAEGTEKTMATDRRMRLEERIAALFLWETKLQESPLRQRIPSAEKIAAKTLIGVYRSLSESSHCLTLNSVVEFISSEGRQVLERALFELDTMAEFLTNPERELALCLNAWESETVRQEISEIEQELHAADDKHAEELLERIRTLTLRLQEISTTISNDK